MSTCIVITWPNIGNIYHGIFYDIYLFKLYLNADIVWINCRKYGFYSKKHNENFYTIFNMVCTKYKNIIFVENEHFSLLNSNIKEKNNHKYYFMMNVEINPVYSNWNTKMSLLDGCIAKTRGCYNKLLNIKNKYSHSYDIIYTNFTSIDYSKFYTERLYFKSNTQTVSAFDENIEYYIIDKSIPILKIISYPFNNLHEEYSFLSFGRKNLEHLINFWIKNSVNLPKLYIKSYHYNFNNVKSDKIEVIDNYITEEEKIQLYNKCIFYINLSDIEGFGHNLNEARSTGRIIICKNKSPMNELVNNEIGFVSDNWQKSIQSALSLTKEQIKEKMIQSRKLYEQDTNYFETQVKKIIK